MIKKIETAEMAKQRETTRSSATEERRSAILKAALDCFINLGFQATTIEEIRARSQASTGSIYHHFVSKEQLAGELYLAGLRDYQQGLLSELSHWQQAEDGIKALVGYHLRWIGEHPDWAHYLFYMRHAEFVAATETEIGKMNRELFRELMEWLKPHIEQGHIIKLSVDLYAAILIGPSQEFARHWLAKRVKTKIEQAAQLLADAAWRALQKQRDK